MTIRRLSGALGAITIGIGLLVVVPSVSNADTTAAIIPFSENWSDIDRIATANDWSSVPSIVGYRGDGLVGATGVDPNTVLVDGAATPVNVIPQSTATSATGGIHEIEASGMVALQGSGTARAPHLVIRLDTTGLEGIGIDYDLVDLDGDDGGTQAVSLQYRVGTSGNYTVVEGGSVADASTTPPGTIHVAAVLPAAADDQPIVDVRIITTDAAGADSMTGIDDITIVAGAEPPPPPPPPPDPVATDIPSVQGAGATTPFEGQAVIVSGIVTALFESADVLDGYFLQDPIGDGNPSTSDGVFVFCRRSCPATLQPGDAATATGTATEFAGLTEISATASATVAGGTTIESSGNPLPVAVEVDLPAVASTQDPATFESTEGMIVTIPQTLAVSEYFELARFGEVVLTEGSRPYQFTHDSAPSVDGYHAFLADLSTRRIILDDDNNDNNDAISGTPDEPYPYGVDGLSVTHRYRGGDTIAGLTGVMHWSWSGASGTDAWRIRPVVGNDYTFTSANPATPVPDVGGTLRVASFNVLNYFTTIDATANDTGPCGPAGDQDCRGADSAAELVQQRAKIVAAMEALDADVFGLIEIQNDDGASTDDLVAGLNAATAPGTYASIDTGTIGGDAIKVAFIYRPAAVSPVDDFAILDSSVDPTYIDTANRPALIQTFEQVGTGERVTVAINHFKSKGSGCTGDADLGDGQGNCNATRTAAAIALAKYLATDPTGSGDPDVLIIGDLNSYRMEDPITALQRAGYTDLIREFEGDEAYSYLFDGQLGYLDQALANAALAPQVTGTSGWTINADEVPLFDYNDDQATVGEASFERESSALELDAADPFRSSDHDPVVIGLDLGGPDTLTIDRAAIVLGRRGGGTATFSGRTNDATSTCPRLGLSIEGSEPIDVPTFPLGRSGCVGAARGALILFDRTTSRFSGLSTLPTEFALADATVRFTLVVDGVAHHADVVGTLRGRVWTGPS